MIETELAKYGITGVAIALAILVGWVIRQFLQFTKDAMADASRRNEHLAEIVRKNTQITEQTYEFLKLLNGKLAKTVKSKIKENKDETS